MPGKGRKRDLRGLPELEGWLTFTEAAEVLKISRQRFYQLAEAVDEHGTPRIKTAQRLGARPTYIVRTAEVTALKAQREGTAPASAGGGVPLFHVAGGVAVTQDDLRQAILLLDGAAGTRGSFKQAMIKAGNPLALSDYMSTARQYRILHPESRGMSTKQALLAAYRSQLESELQQAV